MRVDHDVFVPRLHLVERALRSPVIVLEAPAGYGKTTLVHDLAAALDLPTALVAARPGPTAAVVATLVERALARAGLGDLVGALGGASGAVALAEALAARTEGVVLVVDDAHDLDADGLAWLAELGGLIDAPHHLVVAGRRVGAGLGRQRGAVQLRAADLALTLDETSELLRLLGADPDDASAVHARTEGWPAVVALGAARLSIGGTVPQAGGTGPVAALLHERLAEVDDATRLLVGRLAVLPLLSADVAAVVGGPGTLDRLLDSGVPVRFRPDGWGEIPGVVRDALATNDALGRLEPTTARLVADRYVARGHAAEGAALLHRLGDPVGVRDLLGRLPWHALAEVGLPVVGALLADLPDDLVAEDLGLLARFAIASDADAGPLLTTVLERADRLAPPTGPERRAIDAERARSLGQRGDLRGGIALADAVLGSVTGGPEEALTTARAHLHRAILHLVEGDGGTPEAAVPDLESAIARLRMAGEPRLEARALQVLGAGVHGMRGSFAAAEAALSDAASLLAAPDSARGIHLTYLGEVLQLRGRHDAAEAAVAEAETIGRRLGSDIVVAYASWVRADLAAQRGDRAGVAAAISAALAHPGDWYETLAGVDLHAGAAEMRMRVGDLDGALADLAEAEARSASTGYVRNTRMARARFEALHGDPERVLEAVADVEAAGVGRDRWLCLLLRAVAERRRGDDDAAARLLQQAEQAADLLDEPGRLARTEPELRLAAGGRPDEGTTPGWTLELLGRFAVRTPDGDATPPPGLPSALVKVLAVRGAMSTDEAVELLWPGSDPQQSAARLRNLLHRIRSASGDLIRRVDGGLALAPGVTVDVAAFEQAAADALAAEQPRRTGLARRALGLANPAGLLPTDLYADWTALPRERVRARHLALLDVLIADTLERNDLDEALRLLDDALALDPLTPRRHALATDALARQGRIGAAGAALARGQAAALELGLAVDPDLEAAATRLRGARP